MSTYLLLIVKMSTVRLNWVLSAYISYTNLRLYFREFL